MQDKRLRVLVLDDDDTTVELCISELKRSGFNLEYRLVETLELFDEELNYYSPDIVLSGFHLPGFTGLDILALMEEKAPDTPLIIITDTLDEETAVNCIIQGAADYVLKDRIDRLGPALRNALDKARIHNQHRQALEELSAKEHYYRSILHSMQEDIMLLDREKTVIDINNILLDKLDMKREEVIGRKCHQVLFQRDKPCPEAGLACEFEKVIETGEACTARKELRFAEGMEYWAEILFSPMTDIEGKVSNIILASRDITDVILASQQLRFINDFETLVAEISKDFINLPIEQTDEEIDKALRKIGEFINVDHVILNQLVDEGEVVRTTHEWSAPGVSSHIDRDREVRIEQFPYLIGLMKTAEVINIHNVKEMPPEGKREQAFLRKHKVKTLLLVPLQTGKKIIGFLGVDTVRDYRCWCEDSIRLLLYTGDIIANALLRRRQESELLDSRVRLQALFSSSMDAFLLFSADGSYLNINPAAVNLLGFSREELFDTSIEDFTPPGQEEIVKRIWMNAYELKRARGEAQLKCKNGSIIKVEYYIALDILPNLNLVVMRDITERLKAEEALRESEFRFKELFNRMSSGVVIYEPWKDGEDFIVKDMNKAGELISEVDINEIRGKRLTEVFPGVERIGLLDVFREVHRTGTSQFLPANRYEDDRIVHWVENHVYSLPTGEVVAVYDDISERIKAEEALKESERVLSALISNLPGMVYRCSNDPEWTLKFASDGSEMLTGYPASDLMENRKVRFADLIIPEDRDRVWNEVQSDLEQKQPYELTYRIRHRDGSIRSVWERGEGFYQSDGTLIWLEGFISDITTQVESMEREKQLQKQQLAISRLALALGETSNLHRLYTIIYEHLSSLMDTDSFIISLYDKSSDMIRADFVINEGEPVDSSLPPMIRFDRKGKGSQSRVIATGQPVYLPDFSRIEGSANIEYTITAAGEIIEGLPPDDVDTVTRSAILVPMKVENEVIGVLQVRSNRRDAYSEADIKLLNGISGVASVAIRNARLVDELLTSEEKYRNIIESSNDAICIMYNDRFELINRRFSELFETGREEVRREDFDFMELVAPESRKFIRELEEMRKSGREPPSRYEFVGMSKSGRLIDVEVSISEVTYRDGVAIQGIIRDVTERKQLESQLRQSQKMEGIGRLAGGVAHDFNNLLTVIQGTTDILMLRLEDDDQIKNELKEVQAAAEKASDLTRQLLAFSRKQKLEPKVINLNSVVTGLNKMLRRIIGEDIEFEAELRQDLWNVEADPGQIEQIIINLVINARDAMPSGGTLTIRTDNASVSEKEALRITDAGPGSYCTISVSDTGSGIPEDVLAHIFEPFFTTKEEGKGTGLGLATVYGIVKQSGGFIRIKTAPNEGSTFTLYFPQAFEEQGKMEDEQTIKSAPVGRENILVVEDDRAVRELASRFLKKQGYKVETAESGDEALAMIMDEKKNYQLIITDIVMPRMSGIELVKRIKQDAPAMKAMYISGYTADAVFHAGVLDKEMPFLRKPFRPLDLAKIVRETLDS